MKKTIFVASSIVLLLAIALSMYLLNGCKKNVEPIEVHNSYLDNVDYSGYVKFTNIVDEAIKTNASTKEFDELEKSIGDLLSPSDSLFIASIDAQAISAEVSNTYYLSKQEKTLIEQGDRETLNKVLDRFSQPISILANKQFINILTKLSNDPKIRQYLPQNVDLSNFNYDEIWSFKCDGINILKSASAVDCEECNINYASCVLIASGKFLLDSADAAKSYLNCLAAALLLQAIPFVGQALYIAAVAVCTAKFAYEMFHIAKRYSDDLKICENQLVSCLSNCHQGGSGN
jgi:hypothetical protein